MARAKDVLTFDKDDLEGGKHAPSGKYHVKILAKSAVEPNKAGDGNNLVVFAEISRGKHKGVKFRDYLSANAKWKLVQLMHAIGLKVKAGMKITLQDILKALKGKELRAMLMVDTYNDRKQNKPSAWLPLEAAEDEEDDLEEETDEEAEEEEDEESDEDEEDSEDDDDGEDEEEEDEDEDDDSDDDEDDDESDDDDEEDEEEDEDDDEEEDDEDEEDDEPPVKRRTPAKKTPAKKAPARKKK